MFCKNCGRMIDDNSNYCPQCGAPLDENRARTQRFVNSSERINYLAIIGFALAFLMPIAGLICSVLGRKRATEYGGDGRKLASAGIVLSIVFLVLYALFFFLFLHLWIGYGPWFPHRM